MIDLSTKKLIIFDADGTLRRCTVPGQPCPNKADEWEVIPGVKEKIAALPEKMRFAIVSNQGGVGLGLMTDLEAYSLLERLSEAVFWETRKDLAWVHACIHAPKDGCACRKPSPLMLYKAMTDARSRPAETLYVGDMDSDREAAQRAGVAFLWAWEFFGWDCPEGALPSKSYVGERDPNHPDPRRRPPPKIETKIRLEFDDTAEDAIRVRPKRDLLKAFLPTQADGLTALLSKKTLTIPAGTLVAEYEVEGETAVRVAEQLNAEHGENFAVTALFPDRIKVCTARPITVGLDIPKTAGQILYEEDNSDGALPSWHKIYEEERARYERMGSALIKALVGRGAL